MPNEKITCIGCHKKFQLLLSHLERTKSCQDFYDISSMREEAERLTKEKKAQRSRERYQNDPEDSAKKRTAAKEYYKHHASEKKATMALYYEKHREEINDAKREEYQRDPKKKQAKRDYYYDETRSNDNKQDCLECGETYYTPGDMKRHVSRAHSDESFVTCQICDKGFKCKDNVDKHMKEIHGGERHKCEKCPATYLRKSDLQAHVKEGTHFVSYHCKLCTQTIVFKSLRGLIDHTIVKQSREEDTFSDGTKYEKMKSGILVTCKYHVKSEQLTEGEHVLCMPRKDKAIAEKSRALKKKEIINEGLKLAAGNLEAPQVELEFVKEKHEENFYKDRCKWCEEEIPFSDEFCTVRFGTEWTINQI